MIVHSLDTLPPLQQSAYVVSDSSAAGMAPERRPRPVQAASLAPVSLAPSEPAVAAPLSLPAGRHGAPTLPPMLYLSFAALALLLCARSYTGAGSARS